MAAKNDIAESNVVWMNVNQLSEYIDEPVETIRQWRDRGLGPTSYKMVGKIKYKKHEVDAWIESGKRETVNTIS